MPELDLNKLAQRLNPRDFGEHMQPVVHRLIQFQDPRDLDSLFELAVNHKDFRARHEAEDAIYKLSEFPEFIDLLVRRLSETSSIEQKELMSRVLRNIKDPLVVDALVAVSEKHWTNFRLHESAVWALLNSDYARAEEFCRRAKVNIVVADDEPGILDIMSFTFMFAGLRVLSANNGEIAYKFAKVSRPDLVLLDIRMPRMNGYEACRRLKTDSDTQDIPVVLISAKGQESEIEAGLKAGAVEYIVKPFAPDQLAGRIKSIIRKSQLGVYNDRK